MARCTHLAATFRRHTTGGSLLVLFMSAWVLGPGLWDTVRGEPWIENHLTVVQNSNGAVLVEDITRTKGPAHGVRANTIQAADGSVLCSTEHHNTWIGERKRFWRIEAFARCSPPPEVYRVCSHFAVSSDSGRHRYYGPFCSAPTQPE